MILINKSAISGRAHRKTSIIKAKDSAPLIAFAICFWLNKEGFLSRLTTPVLGCISITPSPLWQIFAKEGRGLEYLTNRGFMSLA
jgi:hypothetical protein